MLSINPYFSNIVFKDSIGLIFLAFIELFKNNNKSKHFQTIFESNFKEKCGIDNIVCTPSNRSGIYLLLSTLNIGKDDEVIITGYTCSAVVEPILKLGAIPIFVDITTDNYCQCIVSLENKITSKTKVIIIQHSYGIAAPILEACKLAKKYQIFLIEDCALALGSKLENAWLGSYGDAGIWSFELSKTISVGWGGVIGIKNDLKLFENLKKKQNMYERQSKLLAIQRLFQAGISGILYRARTPLVLRRYLTGLLFKFRIFISSKNTPANDLRMPSDFQWKFLLNQLNSLEKILQRQKYAAEKYINVLEKYIEVNNNIKKSNLIRFPLIVKNREKFIKYFAKKNIEIGRWFDSPVSGVNLSSINYIKKSCPTAEYISEHVVNLPLHARLTNQQIKNIANILDHYIRDNPEEIKFSKKFFINN